MSLWRKKGDEKPIKMQVGTHVQNWKEHIQYSFLEGKLYSFHKLLKIKPEVKGEKALMGMAKQVQKR